MGNLKKSLLKFDELGQPLTQNMASGGAAMHSSVWKS